jgi:predicted transcriptional regulator
MVASPFSVRLDEDVKERLDREARREDRSAGYIINKAVGQYLDQKDWFRKEMEAAIAEADKGEFISWEKIRDWTRSWGTENELPPPEPDVFLNK